MLGHTKTHLTKQSNKTNSDRSDEKTIPWRDIAQDEIKNYTEAGVMLRGCRYKFGLTQKELAEVIQVSQHHISEMENGKRSIGKEMAKKFADFFNTNYRVFL